MAKIKVDFFLDFETRSRVELKKVGTVRYAADPSTEATLLTYCFGRTGQLQYWSYGQPIPSDIMMVIKEPEDFNFIAYNVGFDYLIWKMVFVPRQALLTQPLVKSMGIEYPQFPLANIHDCMALTSHFRLGNSLESAAQMLKLPTTKDKDGRRIMLKQCKPGRNGKFPKLTQEEWQHFVRYGLIDTRLLREIYYSCPRLPESERWVWEWTFRRNLTGIKIDIPLLNTLKSILDFERPKADKRFEYLTGGNFTMRSAVKCKDWFKQFWTEIDNMQQDTVRDMMMETEGKPPHAVEALKIKEMAGSSSVAKITTAVDQTFFGRIYMLLKYHTAQTKRWAGAGVQIHNFPRPEDNPVDDISSLIMDSYDLASQVQARYSTLKSPLQFIKNLLRRIWIPDDGQTFYCGDFSKVEPTVLRWLSGMGPVPPKVYEEMAAEIYGVKVEEIGKESEERQIGKAAELGGGYGMGWKKFRKDTYKKTGIVLSIEMAKHVIAVYRRKNKPISDMWKELETCFRKAINGESSWACDRRVLFGPMPHPHRGVQIRLPSGGTLYYHHAFTKWERESQEIVTMDANGNPRIDIRYVDRENIYYLGDDKGRVKKIKIYGGQLTEHVTSAIARELLVPSMWRLENAGFDVLMSIHDEIWAQSYEGRDEEFKSLMTTKPHWCQDIDLSASGDNGKRYLK